MKIELWKLADVKPYEKNPRHNESAVETVAASIREFGFRVPIVVDSDGVIICGHTRWKAAQRLELEKVPVHVAKDLAPGKVQAYRIADNKSAELAEWDLELLPLELQDLQAANFDLEMLGFSNEELEKILGGDNSGNPGLTDPENVPEPPDDAVTQRGDIWILGNHRLMCGDSSKSEELDKLLDGKTIQLVHTDPPYNVNVEPRSNNAIAAGLSSFGSADDVAAADAKMHHQSFDLARDGSKSKPTTRKLRPKDRPLANDFVSVEEFDRLLNAWFSNMARVLERGRGFYIWGGYANLANYPGALKNSEMYLSQVIIWDKQHPVLTRKDFMCAFELAYYGWREGAAHYFNPEIKNARDLWQVKKVSSQQMVHLTEKPTELGVLAMTYSSRPGENVLDLFGGSGSTLIAAERCGRNAFLMELDQLYCDVIVKRWEEFTGKKAVRAG